MKRAPMVKIIEIIKLEHTKGNEHIPLGCILEIPENFKIPEGYVELTDSNCLDIIKSFQV